MARGRGGGGALTAKSSPAPPASGPAATKSSIVARAPCPAARPARKPAAIRAPLGAPLPLPPSLEPGHRTDRTVSPVASSHSSQSERRCGSSPELFRGGGAGMDPWGGAIPPGFRRDPAPARGAPASGGGVPDLRGALRRQEGLCVADHLAGSVPGSVAAGSGGEGPAVRPLGVPAAVGALRAPVLQDDWAGYLGEFRKGP